MPFYKKTLFIASLFGALGVILGAFGAHSLKSVLSPIQLSGYETGIAYHFYHTLAMIGTGVLLSINSNKWLKSAAILFLLGILLFSGSLYLLGCRELLGIDAWRSVLGPITPIGGLCFILAWITMAIGSLKIDFKQAKTL